MRRFEFGKKVSHGRDEAAYLWFLGRQDEARALDPNTVIWLEIGTSAVQQAWERVQTRSLKEWKKQHPGTRPSAWWEFSAPRAKPGTFLNKCGHDLDPECKLPEPRRKLSGKGRPSWEVIALAPSLECGLPADWTIADTSKGAVKDWLFAGSIDSSDPPNYESQADYLRRHGLLTSEEANRSDFTPAVMEGDEPCTPNCKCGRHGGKLGTRGKW